MAHDLAALHDHAVRVPHHLRVALVFQDLLLEERPQIPDAAAADRPVHAEEVVGGPSPLDVLRQAVLLPDQERLFPEAEVPDRAAIEGPVVHDLAEAFPVVHEEPSASWL